MKIGQQIKSFVINHPASSLYSLIADCKYQATSLGRNVWKKLIGSKASLQHNYKKEGFNENDCSNCDSRIGFGTGGDHDDSNTCGNEACHGPDSGDQHIEAMGYVLVQ